MDESMSVGAGDVAPVPGAPDGVTHSHDEAFSDAFAVAVVRHPTTGEESRFTFPADNDDRVLRCEFADGTVVEYPNPNAKEPELLDPDKDDVIWNPELRQWVRRVVVTAAEGGLGVDKAVVTPGA